MDDRSQGQPLDRPLQGSAIGAPDGSALADSRALTILTTEHWSLLSARSLVYNESFARGGMFLTFLSATLVALGLVATATGFSSAFLAIAAGVLAVDLFVGLATYGRVVVSNRESFRYQQGMNRLRFAYHAIVPGLEPYFVSAKHDDIRAVIGIDPAAIGSRLATLHYFTTMPGMVAVICASVGAALAADLVLLATGSGGIAGIAAVVVVIAGAALSALSSVRGIAGYAASMDSVFPSPSD